MPSKEKKKTLYREEFLGGKKETNERDKAKIKFVLKYGYFLNIDFNVNFKKDYYSKSKDIHSDLVLHL